MPSPQAPATGRSRGCGRGRRRRRRDDHDPGIAGHLTTLVLALTVDGDKTVVASTVLTTPEIMCSVAQVVELAHAGRQLPDPGVVPHPVGDQVDHPVGAHDAVVVGEQDGPCAAPTRRPSDSAAPSPRSRTRSSRRTWDPLAVGVGDMRRPARRTCPSPRRRARPRGRSRSCGPLAMGPSCSPTVTSPAGRRTVPRELAGLRSRHRCGSRSSSVYRRALDLAVLPGLP